MNILHMEERVVSDAEIVRLGELWKKFRGLPVPKIWRIERRERGGGQLLETETHFEVNAGSRIILHEFLENELTKFVRVKDGISVINFPTYFDAEEYVAGRMKS